MKDCGLGTPATRANIIETLLKRGYVERKRNILQPTAKGIELIQSIQAETLKSPQLTGEWEARLERIRRGEAPRDEFMASIRTFVSELIERTQGAGSPGLRDAAFGPAVGTCPKCGASLHLRDWEGRHYVKCAGPDCKVCLRHRRGRACPWRSAASAKDRSARPGTARRSAPSATPGRTDLRAGAPPAPGLSVLRAAHAGHPLHPPGPVVSSLRGLRQNPGGRTRNAPRSESPSSRKLLFFPLLG